MFDRLPSRKQAASNAGEPLYSCMISAPSSVMPTIAAQVLPCGFLVEVNPQWRGYEYFVYNDEIILVDPRTHRIVAILPV